MDAVLALSVVVAIGTTVMIVVSIVRIRRAADEADTAEDGPEPAGPASREPAPAAAEAPAAAAPPAPMREPTATAELSVLGLGGEAGTSAYVAEIQRRLAAQDRVRFKLRAMGTELEGTTEDILELVAELHRVPLELGLPRAYTVVKLDERTDKRPTLEGKVRSVEERLDHEQARGDRFGRWRKG